MEVFLRPWRLEDAPALQRAYASTADLDTQFGNADMSTEKRAAEYIETFLPFGDAARNWAVIVDDEAVGNVGLSVIERRHQTAWAHYWLAIAARGHGYATRGLIAASDWAFDDGLFRLELGIESTTLLPAESRWPRTRAPRFALKDPLTTISR